MLYRRKPDEIEAVQITDSAFNGAHPNDEHIKGVTYDPVGMVCCITTSGRDAVAVIGDYIQSPIDGKPFFCKQVVFEKAYEPVK